MLTELSSRESLEKALGETTNDINTIYFPFSIRGFLEDAWVSLRFSIFRDPHKTCYEPFQLSRITDTSVRLSDTWATKVLVHDQRQRAHQVCCFSSKNLFCFSALLLTSLYVSHEDHLIFCVLKALLHDCANSGHNPWKERALRLHPRISVRFGERDFLQIMEFHHPIFRVRAFGSLDSNRAHLIIGKEELVKAVSHHL